ncbi:unnamed protein product [Euphydryas editha]|uniref:SWIM-type domain-containing protein n=1 Tax=Euphydryas editha TaxID=104508 RepID=A0AAU9TNL9_EUPED|nr:unnamed protein product [Euphydryas editha]
MYSTWTVPQLKAELKTRGGSLKGRKADLVTRLECFDRNLNFGKQQVHETDDVKMDLPSIDLYWDINASTNLPPVTKQHIQLYYNQFNKKPDDGLQLYEARFLVVVRAATAGEYTFVKGITRASMKRLQYEVNIKIHARGSIEESACECVAGSGTNAHCKHVATVLYAIEHMVREKIIIKHQVPTEKLQKFHEPQKVFTASPLKSSKLPMKRNVENTIFSPCSMPVNKEEYNKRFRSLILNHPSKMPFKQLYEPANPYAVEWDHAYHKENTESKLLNKFDLICITPEKVAQIEHETCEQFLNKNWFDYRMVRLTASKFHTICSLRTTNQENYAKQLLSQRSFSSRAINHGIINEPVALQHYMEQTGLQITKCGLFISQDRPYLGATPDGILGDETVVEVKCPYTSRNKEINNITVPYLIKGDIDGQLKLKKGTPYYYQIQGQIIGQILCGIF